jgi:antitoxin component YwqK of YwqJK toxin-antitoxin module
VLLFVVTSCINFEKKDFLNTEDKAKPKKVKDGVFKSHYNNGKVRAEIIYKEGKKEGLAKEYYETGILFREIEYKGGLKEGVAKRYYKNGNVYQITPYINDTIHGVLKKFRENGKLSSEVPYYKGEACMGLVEYTTQGKVKKKYPTIVITPINTILKNGKYILRVSLSDKNKNVEFFEGKTDSNGCPEYKDYLYTKNGVSESEFFIPPGGFMMQELNFIARVKTLQGNYYITQKKFNLAIENR